MVARVGMRERVAASGIGELGLSAVAAVDRELIVNRQIGAPPLLAVTVITTTLDATETAATLEAVLPAGLLERLKVPVETPPRHSGLG